MHKKTTLPTTRLPYFLVKICENRGRPFGFLEFSAVSHPVSISTTRIPALGRLCHGYRRVRNRRVSEALIQGVETARAVLTTTPHGQVADAALVKWLMEHQKEAGVFATVSELVEQLTDNPAARMTAQEIAERLKRAEQAGLVAAK